MQPLVMRVLEQTRARVLGGDIHVPDKVLSVFEPHTEAIRKCKIAKPTEFGKLGTIQESEHQKRSPARSRVTFRTLAQQWKIDVLPTKYKHSTRKNHQHIIEKHLIPRFGDLALSDVTAQAIQSYVTHLAKAGNAPKSIDHIHLTS